MTKASKPDKGTPRILLAVTKSNFGGAQRYVFEIAKELQNKGFAVAVAVGGEGLLVTKLAAENIPVYPIKNFERDINVIKEIKAAFELRSIITDFSPTIIHLNSSKAGGTGAFMARVCGIKQIIFTAHGWPFLESRSLLWRSTIWFFSLLTGILSHQIITVSQNDYKKTPALVRYKTRCIHTGVGSIPFYSKPEAKALLETAFAIPFSKQPNTHWLVSNAELTQNKNLSAAITAVVEYNKTADKKIYYSLISNGDQVTLLQKAIDESGAGEYIQLVGYVDNARVYLKAFDMFILPSKKEGFPYALLEAGAAGLPVIASRVGGIPELIKDSENGLLIDPNSTRSIVEALTKITSDQSLRAKLGPALQAEVANHFTLSKMLDETLATYTTTLSRT